MVRVLVCIFWVILLGKTLDCLILTSGRFLFRFSHSEGRMSLLMAQINNKKSSEQLYEDDELAPVSVYKEESDNENEFDNDDEEENLLGEVLEDGSEEDSVIEGMVEDGTESELDSMESL